MLNTQQIIIKGLREQLFLHDFIVLPGFGGFVLKKMPARFGGTDNVLLPPSKVVGFNAQLRQNDGIMVSWLTATLGCTTAQSLTHLEDFAGYCREVLNARRRLTIPELGFFFLDTEGNTCFEPRHDVNFLTSAFGLPNLHIKPLEQPRAEPMMRRAPLQPAVVRERRTVPYRRIAAPAIAAVLVASLIILLVTNRTFSGNLMAAFTGPATTTYIPMTYEPLRLEGGQGHVQAYVAGSDGIATIILFDGKTVSVRVNGESGAKPVARRGKGEFEIVTGCFSVHANAVKMAARLKRRNLPAAISPVLQRGMHVVTIADFTTKDSAAALLQQIKSEFPSAWIRSVGH
jgi:hypothetical protein